MYYQFVNYIEKENLFQHTNKLLLGVSGGVDSVVLAHLVDRLGSNFALAHCNFNLRDEESHGDELFVSKFAEDLGVKCFNISFDTKDVAEELGISIEMAARKLRYDWFEKLRVENHFDYIVVGHHLDDVLETFFLNLSRGTGIRGLSGIKPKVGKVVRPLLFASRKQIEAYATENELSFRFDSSNDELIYKRNKVRHQILPLFDQLSPAFRNNMKRTIEYLKQTEEVYLNKVEDERQRIVSSEAGWVKINKAELEKLKPISIYLYELLRPYNFSPEIIESLLLSIDVSGTQFFSPTHRLIVDRETLILTPVEIEEVNRTLFYVDEDQNDVSEPLPLKISVQSRTPYFKIPTSPRVAAFDFEKVNFPLVIRKWQQGEYFKPLGMSGFKKLSDFFIDEKFSIPEKETTWVLTSDDKIVWIVGKRIDDRFKITKETQTVLLIEIQE